VDERTWRATSSRVECLCGNACYAHFCEARAEALAFCGQPDAEPVHRGLNTAALVGQDARTIEIGTFTEYYGTAFVFSKSDGSLLGGYRGDELCGPDEEQKGSGNRQTRGRMHQTCRRAAGQERVDLPTLRLR
jgi:hypothetical protein